LTPPGHDACTAGLAAAHPRMVGISFASARRVNVAALKALYAATEDVILALGVVPVFIPHHARGGRGDLDVAGSMAREWRKIEPVVLTKVPPAPSPRSAGFPSPLS